MEDIDLSPFHFKSKLIYFAGFLNFLGFSFTIIAIAAKINKHTNGDADITSSESSTIYFTVYLLQHISQLLTSKYNSALSDFIGEHSYTNPFNCLL